MIVLVFLRVVAVILVWLLLFLAVFLGYLTIPLVILTTFLAVYATLDLRRWLRRLTHRREEADRR